MQGFEGLLSTYEEHKRPSFLQWIPIEIMLWKKQYLYWGTVFFCVFMNLISLIEIVQKSTQSVYRIIILILVVLNFAFIRDFGFTRNISKFTYLSWATLSIFSILVFCY
jgi:hypothetical protein